MKNVKNKVKRRIKKIISEAPKKIKLQLDYKTFIIVNKMSSVKMWMQKFPDARVLSM